MVRKTHYDDTAILLGRVMPDVSEIQVPRQQRVSVLTGVLCNLGIRSSRQPDIARKFNLMTARSEGANCRSWQVGIDQEAHTELDGGQRVKRFLLRELG